jgi:K+-transporting ATPase KdpF subunit
MDAKYLLLAIIPSPTSVCEAQIEMNGNGWYTIGGIIALCLLGYLIYSLLKPENF